MGRFVSGLAFLLVLDLGACRSRVANQMPQHSQRPSASDWSLSVTF